MITIQRFLIFISVSILPIVFSFLIYKSLQNINKSINNNNCIDGKVENFGDTIKLYKSSKWLFPIKYKVFYIKLLNNDTIYSYSNKAHNYKRLHNNIKYCSDIKIYTIGYNSKQNTSDIIQLEANGKILIDKKVFETKSPDKAVINGAE